MQKNKTSGSAVPKAQIVKRFVGSKSFSLSIALLLGSLGLVLALGWVNTSFAYEDEGEIDVSLTTSHNRLAYRVVVEGNHITVKYYGGTIVEGEETVCRSAQAAKGFELVPSTTHPANQDKIFHEYTENDKLFYINDKYDYICFMVLWGVWAGGANSGISYGPYRMGLDVVTADNYDDLLEQTEEKEEEKEEEEIIPDNPPVLAINQSNTVLSATATDDNLDPNSWQNAGPFATDPVCDSEDLTYNSAGSNQYSLTLTTADNDQWYCFKVSDTANNTDSLKYQVAGVIIEEEPDNNNPDQGDTNDMNNDPDQGVIDNQEEDNNNGGLVSRRDTGSDGNSNGDLQQQSSAAATTPPVEPVVTGGGVGDGDPDITDTGGIIDKQGWLQLLGVAIVLIAALGFARIMIMKKRRRV